MRSRPLVLMGLLLASAAAHADLTTSFEPGDGYSGSPGGTPLTLGFGGGGQNGWYQPINGGADVDVYHYGGNALGLNANPMDAGQFIGGRSAGGSLLPRAQHAHTFSTSTVWGISYDLAANWLGVGASAPNLSSFTLQPTAGPQSRYFNAVNNFIDPNNPALGWNAEYSVFDAGNAPLNNQSPGPAWTNLTINHWYRQSTTIDFATNTITEVSITDLSTGFTVTASPVGWYLYGGAAGNAPLPTDVRFFVGGASGNAMGWDRLSIGGPSVWYADADGDSYGDAGVSMLSINQPPGYVAFPGDCDDANPFVNPGAAEVCNGIDDNCNAQVDEGVGSTWYLDADGDGFGDPASAVFACSPPNGYILQPGDCDDTNPSVYAGAPELCDGLDNNCNGQTDEGIGSTWYRDFDGDGYGDPANTLIACTQPGGYVAIAGDCNDGSATIYPGALETCNGVDDNCNGQTDEGLGVTWYADADGDTYGDVASTVIACAQPNGYVAAAGDCDDTDPAVNPGVFEVCTNNIDDNCDGQIDEGCCLLAFAPKASFQAGDVPYAIAVADFNRDGIPDLAVANFGHKNGGSVSVLLGAPGGGFPSKKNATAGSNPCSLVAGDFNHDGNPDLAVANNGSSNVSILLGKGDGSFKTKVDYGAGGKPSGIAAADFDYDGSLDLAVTNDSSNTLSILFGVADGTFKPKVDYGTGASPASVALGDFNRDGRPDLVVANYAGNSVSVFLADAVLNGKFSLWSTPACGTRPRAVAVGDIDQDGIPDLATANFMGNNASVLIGKGDGTFLAKADYAIGNSPQSIAVGDLDGDLLPELAVANAGGGSISVRTGLPGGGFKPRDVFGAGASPRCVILADMDLDGRLDLVVAGAGASVLANDGGTWLWYPDADTDGYGDSAATPVRDCIPPGGSVANADDCDDANPAVHPGAPEVCDGVDNNCDGNVDEHTDPFITQDPVDVFTKAGTKALFSVSDVGGTAWQWRKDGVPILGATGKIYQINSVQQSDVGTYDALVSNACGQALSAGADLTISQPPVAPSQLTGTEVSKGTVTLNWKDNSGGKNITEFQVWRSAFAGGVWQKAVMVAKVPFNLKTYTESPGGGVWRYRVRAANGNAFSTWTNYAVIVPLAPTGLSIQNVSGSASLSWTDNSDCELSFTIQRAKFNVGKKNWDPAVTLPLLGADAIQLTDSPGTGQFRYRIRADTVGSSSAWSSWVTIKL